MVPTGELSRQEWGTITQISAHSLGSSDGNGDDADGADDVGDDANHLNRRFWVLKTFPLLFLAHVTEDGYDYSLFPSLKKTLLRYDSCVKNCLCLTCTTQCVWGRVGFPGGPVGKVSACHLGDLGLIPGLGSSPGERNGNLLQYSCLEYSMHEGAWKIPWMEEPGKLQSMGLQTVYP